jgi:hypothetical protein
MKRHLTSEDFSNWMIGEKTAEHEEHLRSCGECAAELEKLQAPLLLFRGAVRDWSADQRVRVAQQTQAAGAARRHGWMGGALWTRWTAAGVGLVLALAIGIGGNQWRQEGALRVEQARAEQEDEALLGNIQAAVTRPVPATMQPVYNLMAQGSASVEGAK